MITFEPKEKVVDVEENILFDGKVVGTLRPYSNEHSKDKFQASFSLPCYMLAIGYGVTRQDAIGNALDNANKGVSAAYVRITELHLAIEAES